ncbi:MAG: NAD(P)/FAD-dependent oxidoreductase [Atopobiaceae bacterium]|nr:NAD(P)/FAD-dependent oxidoreductase [Atopobiaceae bacterium]MCI2173497.1 NAD(P)/FAD-dependent oxidoreductase [Atopobiaceae bacterium]MCI2207492.1 NAD(P)/FAD-dependent oxidoreductase [Atopobiaceae bacterium]
MRKRAVVIGAGPAGITAAHELLSRAAAEFDVTVLEASRTIGGISRTVVHDGNRMDIGGHRFFTKEERVSRWWDERMPGQGAPSHDDRILHRDGPLTPGGPDPETEDRVMLTRRRVSRIYYDHKFFDYPVSLSAKTLKAMGFGTTMGVGLSYLGACAHKLPEDSLENFYVNRFGRKLYSMFFEGYTEKLWGRHPSVISADWGSQRVKGLSVKAVLKDMVNKATGHKDAANTETSLIEQFHYPKLGPGQLWEQAAGEVETMGGHIRLDCRVTGVTADADGNVTCVSVTHADGSCEDVPCDVCLSTMPLKDLAAAFAAKGDVPEAPAKVAAGLPYRDFVTVGLLVDRLNLKNETDIPTLGDIVPDNWIYVQDSHVRLGRIQVFNNWSPYLVADPENTVWIGLEYFCAEGDDFWNMPADERVEFARRELVSMGVLDGGQRPIDSHVERVQKAYPAYFDTYDDIDVLIAWLDEHPNLFCMGRNGQHRYNNMDHSMMTAFLSVDGLLAGTTDRTNVWNVNTDEDYQEEKGDESGVADGNHS